jgi:hypothetical protein
MRMGHGFRSALRLAVTVATAAAVVGAAATARRILSQPAANPPRHRASSFDAAMTRPAQPTEPATKAPPTFHPFGPEPCVIPFRSIEIPFTPPAEVIELEASGELDGETSPTERLLARRHASDGATSGSARDGPLPVRRYG